MNTSAPSDPGSLKRGVLLLKLLATAGPRGCALTELSEKAGLPHPSAHRILKQLIDQRLADRDHETHRYKLGVLAFELGIAASTMYDIRDLCAPAMASLAEDTEDTVYLVVRSGFEAVCMHRFEGSFPIRTLVLEVGSRRPLGVGAGGLAILAAIGGEEQQTIIARVGPGLAAFGRLTEEMLAQACTETRKSGVAVIRDRVNFGVTAAGMHFRDSMNQAVGAVSVAALTQRLTGQRLRSVSERLRQAVTDIEASLRQKRALVGPNAGPAARRATAQAGR